MPLMEINGLKINYELDGEGEEVLVLLNGIMMSTASWGDFVPVYTVKNNYRLLRLDFRDQGESDKYPVNYDVSIHVADLKDLLEKLKLKKIHLLGVSYGAMVAMLFALDYPEYISSLILPNVEARVSNYLKAVSDIWEEAAHLNSGKLFFKLGMPHIYSDDFYNRKWEWLQKRGEAFDEILDRAWFDSLVRLSRSSRDFDILDRLTGIKVPTLLIGGTRDIITPVYEMEKIKDKIPGARMLIIHKAGHASFYERPAEFNAAVLGFMALNKNI